jgi:hypothetical protein
VAAKIYVRSFESFSVTNNIGLQKAARSGEGACLSIMETQKAEIASFGTFSIFF